MPLRFATVLLLFLTASPVASAQNSHSPFRPLDLPTPTDVRTASGRPGAAYWQQRVDYRIAASLDPTTQILKGRETIRYENHSPDALPHLWLHLEQNMCDEGSVSNTLRQPPLIFLGAIFDFTCQGHVGGMSLKRVAVDGQAATIGVYGTTMRIDLAQPLAPGHSLEIDIEWQFVVPPYGMARMGRDGTLYEMAQWYPRMAVYDDVRGWNHEPYIGAGEFYLEYGDFDVELTLPSDYVVVATGVLQNPQDVLSDTQRNRLDLAMRSSEPVAIITAEEVGGSDGSGTKSWHFRADTVRDFAFAASPEYRWDATSWDGILIQALYRDNATKWQEAIVMSREAIRHFSEKWHRYPYPHATTVEGPIEGMEYPMLTFVPDSPTREDLQWVVSHEFGHEWFPMLVGSNERLYPWMDEGFNTFMDLEGAANYFAGTEYGETIESNPLALYAENAIRGQEQAVSLPASEQTNLFWTAYQKPALLLGLLRNEVLGPERFDPAFRAYIDAWKNRHPTPSDFFRVMRDVSGMDLDWFWRGWILTAARLDQDLSSVQRNDQGETVLVIENRAEMVMPVELLLEYASGDSETVRLPVEMWNQGPAFTWTVPGTRELTRITIDPRAVYPDEDRTNNTWSR
jgi:peptidase M1-like protein